MKLMTSRYLLIKAAYSAYFHTSIPLLKFNESSGLTPLFTADDPAIYILIPKIAHFFNINIDSAINYFFYVLLIAPTVIGLLGFFKLTKNNFSRFFTALGLLLLTFFAHRIGDVYLVYFSCNVVLIPWTIYFSRQKINTWHYIFYFIAGFIGAFCHFIRAYSGLGAIFFILTSLILNKVFATWQKITLFLMLLIGASSPVFYFNHQIAQSKQYVIENFNKKIDNSSHIFWHAVYVGFGFLQLNNPDNIVYSDPCALKKARKTNPTVKTNDPEYEHILKKEVLNLIKNHLVFVLFTIFAKIGVLLLYFLLFANIGILAAFLHPLPLIINTAFFAALSFYALFPILTVPVSEYSLGFITISALWGLTNIIHTLDYRAANKNP